MKRKKIVWNTVSSDWHCAYCGGRQIGFIDWTYTTKKKRYIPYPNFVSEAISPKYSVRSAKLALEKAFDKFLKDVSK